jgi:hypothetical protein
MRTRITLLVCALALAVTGACKGKDSKKQKTPGAKEPAAEKPVCPAGQLQDATGKCVTAVTPDKVGKVKKQAQQMGLVADTLAQFEKLEAPLAIVKLLMKSDAWKDAAKASSDLKTAEAVVKALDVTVKEIKAFSAQATTARKTLDAVVQRLSAVQGGTANIKTIEELRKMLTEKLIKALEPLAKKAQAIAKKALGPAKKQIEKVVEYLEAVCAIVKLGGADNLKKECSGVKSVTDAALAWIEKAQKTPDTFVADTVRSLSDDLGALIDAKALSQVVQ